MNNSELIIFEAKKGWVKFPVCEPQIVAKSRPEYWRKWRAKNREKVRAITRAAMRRYRARLAERTRNMWTCPVCRKLKSCDWCYDCDHVTKRNRKLPERQSSITANRIYEN